MLYFFLQKQLFLHPFFFSDFLSKMHAHPVLVLPLMMGGGVFFYLITRPNASHSGVWETWSHVAVSAATLLACLWLSRKK